MDLDQVGLSVFQWMPHTVGIVTFGGEPAVVPDHLVAELRKRVQEISDAGGEIFYGLKQGDTVIIQSGPFQGYEAIFNSRLPGSEKVRVLLELMVNQRQVPVEIKAGQIVRKK